MKGIFRGNMRDQDQSTDAGREGVKGEGGGVEGMAWLWLMVGMNSS